jgi:dihydroceramidase
LLRAQLLLSIHGVVYARRARLPTRVLACYAGQSLIGIGSTLFHATLQHKHQVLDEVPMLWITSLLSWCAFEVRLATSGP